jgi:hypothetical protein
MRDLAAGLERTASCGTFASSGVEGTMSTADDDLFAQAAAHKGWYDAYYDVVQGHARSVAHQPHMLESYKAKYINGDISVEEFEEHAGACIANESPHA